MIEIRTNLLELMESRRDLMHISVETPSERVEVNAWDELKIDMTDLDTEFAALAGQIAYWVGVSARHRAAVEAARRDFDNWYAPKYEEEFKVYNESMGKRPNINTAENLVKMKYREEFNRRSALLDQADADLRILAGMVTSLDMKGQALIQIAKRQNIEYDRTETHLMIGGAVPRPTPQAQHPQFQRSRAGEASTDAARDILRRMKK